MPKKGTIWNIDIDVEKAKDSKDGGENPFADHLVTNSVSTKLMEDLKEIPAHR